VLATPAAFVVVAARSKGLTYHCEIADDVPELGAGRRAAAAADPGQLLSNAVKFTDHGHVRLGVTTESDGRDTIRFVVDDTGIGIDAGQAARLFEPFEQADNSTTRTYGGAGLGLAICNRLAGMMGGSIAVTGTPGSGSCFTLRLPLPPSLPAAAAGTAGVRAWQAAGLSPARRRGRRGQSHPAGELLRHEGAEVVFAEDGQQAVQRRRRTWRSSLRCHP
jgi:hypothetical protein